MKVLAGDGAELQCKKSQLKSLAAGRRVAPCVCVTPSTNDYSPLVNMPGLTVESISKEVHDFYVANPIGSQPADAFAAWWLYRRWNVERLVAQAYAPSGSCDFGLDAFHFESRADRGHVVLHLIQAKFSSSKSPIQSATREFAKAVPLLKAVLEQTEFPAVKVNDIWPRLHAAFSRLTSEDAFKAEQLQLRFEVVHICPDAPESIAKAIEAAGEPLDHAMGAQLPRYSFGVRAVYPPSELEPDPVKPSKQPFDLRFSGEMISDNERVRFFAGFGYLSDLVDAYNRIGEAIFSKNVRSYLYRAHERGPARYMRESLKRACVRKNGKLIDEPTRFAMLHNGVTVAASSVEATSSSISVFEPNVLNGCQTVKNAALWHKENVATPQFDEQAWRQLRVPIRVLVSQDEEFITDVTISNNRQNAIRPSAFRANHQIQVALAERLRSERGIFYERQESAFENLKRTDSRRLEDEFSNSISKPLRMEELALAIACASRRPSISVAAKVSDLFEESNYRLVFAEEKLKHLDLLVFLRNALVALPLVLRDFAGMDKQYEKISQGKFAYPCLRALSRWIVYHDPDLVEEFGRTVYRSFPSESGLRPKLRSLMNGPKTRLRQVLKDHYLDATGVWKSANDQAAMESVLLALQVDDVDTFKVYSDALIESS